MNEYFYATPLLAEMLNVEQVFMWKIAMPTAPASHYDGAIIEDIQPPSNSPDRCVYKVELDPFLSYDELRVYEFQFLVYPGEEVNDTGDWDSYNRGIVGVVTGENPYDIPIGVYLWTRQAVFGEYNDEIAALPTHVKIYKEIIQTIDPKYLPLYKGEVEEL